MSRTFAPRTPYLGLWCVIWLLSQFLSSALLGSSTGISLLKSTVTGTGDVTYSVLGADDSTASFLWSIDGKPLSPAPLAEASTLVLYANQQSPGSLFQVVVYQSAVETVTLSGALNLAVSGGTDSSSTAGSTSSSVTTPNSSAGGTTIGSANSTSTGSSSSGGVSGAGALINLSCRGPVTPGKPLIVGLIISGTDSKPILVRALGPALKPYGVSGFLANPTMILFSGSTVIGMNDDWSGTDVSNATQNVGAFPLVGGSHDSAVYTTLSPGGYTAHLNTADNTSGVGLIEFYDAAPNNLSAAKLVNISARGISGTGDSVMIVGFTISGRIPKQVLIRAVGPTLVQYGVTDSMPDPKLTVYSGSTAIAQNDNWSETSNLDALAAATLSTGASALSLGSKDSALTISLAPGGYTAIATTGASSDASGEVLLEVYEIP